jgi:GYF domain 2
VTRPAAERSRLVPNRWFYVHGGRTLGPVHGDELRGLVAAGELDPGDLIWEVGVGPLSAVPAEAALPFRASPAPEPLDPELPSPIAPGAAQPPDWLGDLADAKGAAGGVEAALPLNWWLEDVRRAEEAPTPPERKKRPEGGG